MGSVPDQPCPVDLFALEDAARALYMSKDAAYRGLRKLGLPYYLDTRRTGPPGTPAYRATYVPRESFVKLRQWRWRRLVPRQGAPMPPDYEQLRVNTGQNASLTDPSGTPTSGPTPLERVEPRVKRPPRARQARPGPGQAAQKWNGVLC